MVQLERELLEQLFRHDVTLELDGAGSRTRSACAGVRQHRGSAQRELGGGFLHLSQDWRDTSVALVAKYLCEVTEKRALSPSRGKALCGDGGLKVCFRFTVRRRFEMIASATLTERRSWWPLGAILTAVLLQSCLPARATFASDFGDDSEAAATGSDEGAIHQDQYREVKERPARFEIEAEAFTSRNSGSAQGDWVKVASKTNLIQDCGRDGEAAATTPGDARRGTYILAVGKNAAGVPGSAEYDGPTVDYKVNVITPGTYRLYLRWAGKDDNTDSVYAMLIAEKGDSPKGPEFFLYHGRSLKYYDGWVWDWYGLKEQTRCAFAGRAKVAEWEIDTPGVYTIRLACREHGTAVDSLVFQTKDLRPPGNPRDAMRVKPGMRGVIMGAESIQTEDHIGRFRAPTQDNE
jgi:hypothetical protein